MNTETLIVSLFQTPIGALEVYHDECFVYRSSFTSKAVEPHQGVMAHKIEAELKHYFDNPKHQFQLPLKTYGTDFQLRVGTALLAIPAGNTVSYGELAKTLQSGPRAIGQACRTNPLPLFIPCHRVTGKNNLGGYMGKEQAVSYKTALLRHEAAVLRHPE